MLGFFAHVARVSPLHDARLNAHALLGQRCCPTFVKQREHHRLPTRHRNHAQWDQALIKDADGSCQAQSRRSNPLLGGSPQQQGAQQRMGQQQGVEFLDHSLRRQRAQGARRQAQHGPGFSDRQFGMPAPWLDTGTDPARWSPSDRPVRLPLD